MTAELFIEPVPTGDNGQVLGDRPAYRFLAAVDLKGFSRLSTFHQMCAQSRLHLALDTAASQAGLNRSAWIRQLSGDGELAILPADADGLRLIVDYPVQLARELRRLNLHRPHLPRIRVRLALHHGTTVAGRFGPAGQAPIVVMRLLDSDLLRAELSQDNELDVALIISAALYEGLVEETGFEGVDPTDFHPVEVRRKGISYSAYIHRPRTSSSQA